MLYRRISNEYVDFFLFSLFRILALPESIQVFKFARSDVIGKKRKKKRKEQKSISPLTFGEKRNRNSSSNENSTFAVTNDESFRHYVTNASSRLPLAPCLPTNDVRITRKKAGKTANWSNSVEVVRSIALCLSAWSHPPSRVHMKLSSSGFRWGSFWYTTISSHSLSLFALFSFVPLSTCLHPPPVYLLYTTLVTLMLFVLCSRYKVLSSLVLVSSRHVPVVLYNFLLVVYSYLPSTAEIHMYLHTWKIRTWMFINCVAIKFQCILKIILDTHQSFGNFIFSTATSINRNDS